MPVAYFLVAILPVIAACLSGRTALYAWQRREVNGSRAFALCSASIFIWCFFASFEQLAPTASQQITFGRLQYLGIPTFPAFWFVFTLRHTQYDKWLNRRALAAFSVIPVLSMLLAFSDRWHGWVWKAVEFQPKPFPRLVVDHGWWFNYVIIPHCYVLMLLGFCALLIASFHGPRLRQQQTLMLLGAVLVTFMANVIYVMADVTLYGLDPTPVGFGITALLIQLSLFHSKFLDVAPISYKTVFMNTTDAVILLDKRRRIVDLNPSALAESQRKVDATEVVGQSFDGVFSEYREILAAIKENDIELTKVLKLPRLPRDSVSGHVRDVFREVKVRSLIGPRARQTGWIVMIRDVTLEKQEQERLEQLVYVDSLTGLFNRRHLELAVEESLAPTPIPPNPIALLYLDLNHFKPINDNYGHDVGDIVLQHFAHCLQKSVRQGDMVARLGGDEFVAVLYGADLETALEVRSRLVKLLDRPVSLAGHQFKLSASIGVARYPKDGSTLSELLLQADENMYREKRLR